MTEAEIALVLEILDEAYARGGRVAFAEAAKLTEIAGGMFSGRTGLDQVDEGVAVHRAFWTLIAMFRRRADPDAKVADPDPGVGADG